MAMLLLTAVGYVLSYLLPTKQKSVLLALHSPQAFSIAQAGVEYGIRYGSDQGWRTTTDLLLLNGAGVAQRNLGNGRFTIQYNNATDTLTSTGEIPSSNARRAIRISNFTQFLRLIFSPTSPPPCWSLGTQQVRFYIKNIRGENVTLTAFSATWIQDTPTRQLRTIDMDGVQKFSGNYVNGSPAVDFNRGGNQQTILPNQVISVVVAWNNNITNGRSMVITFYNAAGKSYAFNLDTPGDGLPGC